MTDYAPTAASYNAIAADYAEHFSAPVESKPWARALFDAFTENVSGPVADVGCGPGMTTGLLRERGVEVFGIDLSAEMLDIARRRNPQVRFEIGSMAALELSDESLGGILAWYSVIHTEPEDLPAVFAEFHRVLRPGGHLALAFQVGDEPLRLTDGFGHPIDLVFHRFTPEWITALLTDAGFRIAAALTRQADPHERTPQAHLLARKESVE